MSSLSFFKRNKEVDFLEFFGEVKSDEIRAKEIFIEKAIDLIAKTIAKSEIQIFKEKSGKVESVIDNDYYMLNIKPNPNQSATTFMYDLVSQLLRENEALVIKKNDALFVADRFEASKDILYGKTYSEVHLVDDHLNELKLNGKFTSEDVLYFSLGNSEIKRVLDEFYKDQGSLLAALIQGVKSSNFKKYVLKTPTNTPTLKDAETKEPIKLEEYANKLTGKLLQNSNSITTIPATFELEENSKTTPRDSKDVRELIKDYGDKVAMAFNIPLDIFYGNKTDKSTSTNDFLTFAIEPILNIVEDEMNDKFLGQDRYLKGDRVKFNKLTMKHFDIVDVASSFDKLFAIGWSHNELKEIAGQPTIQEAWADRHHVTKNYMDVEETLKGGERDEDEE